MSQAKPPLPHPGDDRDLAVVNNVFTAIGTASGAIDGTNIAEEGLDETSLQSQSNCPIYFTGDARTVNANGIVYATAQVGGGNFRSAGFTVEFDQLATVTASVQCTNETAGANVGIPVGSVVSMRLRKSVSGVITTLTGTTMDQGDTKTGCFKMTAHLTPGVYDWIEVQSKCVPAANYYLQWGSIIVETSKRAT